MKTVITSSGNNISATFDKRFGRAAWFCLIDEENNKITFLNNGNISSTNGAGTKAAERMVELGIGKVISGDFGPKAKDLLNKFDIQMVIIRDEGLTIEDIINKMKH